MTACSRSANSKVSQSSADVFSDTSQAARSRTSGEYLVDLDRSIHSKVGASGKAGPVHTAQTSAADHDRAVPPIPRVAPPLLQWLMTRSYQKGHAHKVLRVEMTLPWNMEDDDSPGVREASPAYRLRHIDRLKEKSLGML